MEDASTRATRASVRRVELSLQPGNAEPLSSRPEHMQHMAVMPQRDMRLPYMGGRAGPGSRGGASPAGGAELGGMDIRSVSREKVLLHNRPESMSSVFSLLSPSERLLASRPVSSKSKGSRVPSAASSAFGAARGTSVSVGWSSKTAPVEVRLDLDEEAVEEREAGEGGEGPGTSTPRGPGRGARTVMVDLDLSRGEQEEEEEEERRLAQQAAEGQCPLTRHTGCGHGLTV